MRPTERQSTGNSERDRTLAQLFDQVEGWTSRLGSGAPEGFVASRWLDAWLEQPSYALRGQAPIALLDTADGRAVVARLLSSIESGTYW